MVSVLEHDKPSKKAITFTISSADHQIVGNVIGESLVRVEDPHGTIQLDSFVLHFH